MTFMSATALVTAAGGTFTGNTTFAGGMTISTQTPLFQVGLSTSGGITVNSTPGFSSGTASQLSDTFRDYMVYFQIGTGGGTIALAIGPTAGVANSIMSAAAGVSGELISVYLPAGWFLKITLVTSTITSQIAISI